MEASCNRVEELEGQTEAQDRAAADLAAKLDEMVQALEACKAAAATAATDAAALHAVAVGELNIAHAAALEEMMNKALDIEVLTFVTFLRVLNRAIIR